MADFGHAPNGMSPGRGERVISRRRPIERVVRRLPLFGWLVAVWLLLWGTYDVGTVVFGVLVALLVMWIFPAPPIATDIRLRPLGAGYLVLLLAWDLVASTARVAWQAVRHRGRARAAIVAVPLVTDSDHLMAMVANAVSLAPGKFVMQIDRVNRVCYVYELGVAAAGVDAVRRDVLGWERRVVRAVGTAAQVESVERMWRSERAR